MKEHEKIKLNYIGVNWKIKERLILIIRGHEKEGQYNTVCVFVYECVDFKEQPKCDTNCTVL